MLSSQKCALVCSLAYVVCGGFRHGFVRFRDVTNARATDHHRRLFCGVTTIVLTHTRMTRGVCCVQIHNQQKALQGSMDKAVVNAVVGGGDLSLFATTTH